MLRAVKQPGTAGYAVPVLILTLTMRQVYIELNKWNSSRATTVHRFHGEAQRMMSIATFHVHQRPW